MSKHRLHPLEMAAAIQRVCAEEPVPVAELVGLAGASAEALADWIVSGRRGVHLDGYKERGVWYSSRAAVLRFLGERARAELDREAAG